ncbi:MAG: putative undecaprenyl-phosphate N-acetylglucosaminyl 1-phosphate transferase [Gammaproteobacteria bacterium]|nr:putative undecaprenyl-phosphate N-acetylglucosaminyl 1-phosphate transferase [Gammaproteobacteria bacterium]
MNPGVATAVTIAGSFLASAAATWLVRGWFASRRIVDSPNDRSLHHKSTVTGGGIAVSSVLIVIWLCLMAVGVHPTPALLIPVAALSLVGLMDDVYHLGWLQKLSLQVLVAIFFIAAFGAFSRLELFGMVIEIETLNLLFSVLWIVALVNIYNFMDGIDGLAGSYGALCACILGVWFVILGGGGLSLYLYGLMAACLGFLVWNWAPARIFLGDTGSMMLGGTLAAVGIVGQREYDIPLSAFVLLYGVFIGDTVYTLVRRTLRGEKIWQAHKGHLYQRAVQSGLTHSAVTGTVLLISAIIGVLASLEMGRTGPRVLWLILSLSILYYAMALVKKREVKRS